MNYTNKTIDDLLHSFQPEIRKDFDSYRNHVYRVFLNCQLLDESKQNEEKYAIASVFHDIGIWTNTTIDYLDPSIEQAQLYLTNIDKQDWIDELSLMIYWHHKLTPYKGDYEKTVEVFRKADWIDVSLGLLSFGADKQKISQTRKEIPNLGFHLFLIKAVTKNSVKHPLNPLPMFTK